MNKKQIKKLVEDSYNDGTLDEKVATIIADKLNRKSLRSYIKELKRTEKETSIVVTLPVPPTQAQQKLFSDSFPKKKIVYNIEPKVLMGARVTDNDTSYDYTLKDVFENFLEYIEEKYD